MNKESYVAITLLSMVVGGQMASAAEGRRPNIIVLMTDDQSYTTINALGNESIMTPNINRLVERGVSFMNHYATTSISMASRAQVMTGMYEYKTGCNFSQGNLSIESFKKSYPVLLRKSGYYTGFAGKFGFEIDGIEDPVNLKGYEKMPVRMFNKWGGGKGQTSYKTESNHYIKKYAEQYPHSSSAYGAFACDFIDNAVKSDKPFCLSISFKAPHNPMTPDPRFDELYKDVVIDYPACYAPEFSDDILPMQAKLGRQYLTFFGQFGFGDFESYQEKVKNYYRLIYGVDQAVGTILEKLEQEGLTDDTIVIYTSDNGHALGDRRLGGKCLAYECTSRIPLIVVDPDNAKRAGERVECVTGNIDIAPTVMSYAGVEAPEVVDGAALCGVIDGSTQSVREHLNLISTWGSPQTFTFSIVTDQMKYIYWGYADGMDVVEELFDLDKDPRELENLADNPKYSAKLKQLRKIYDEELERWSRECVKDRYYHQYPTIYSRHLPWEERKESIPATFMNGYKSLVKSLGYKDDPFDYESVIEHRKK